ncbi:MAG TPA: hypothetical protein VLH10_09040, partial [Yinghuangia sp.]|nr:hypothetical protein [Yinghuangia sp.]
MIELSELSLAQRMFLLAYDPARTRVAGRDKLGLVLHAAALQGRRSRSVHSRPLRLCRLCRRLCGGRRRSRLG